MNNSPENTVSNKSWRLDIEQSMQGCWTYWLGCNCSLEFRLQLFTSG